MEKKESIHDKNIQPENQRVELCPECNARTFQKAELYNPDSPEEGEVWVCRQCNEAIEFIK